MYNGKSITQTHAHTNTNTNTIEIGTRPDRVYEALAVLCIEVNESEAEDRAPKPKWNEMKSVIWKQFLFFF